MLITSRTYQQLQSQQRGSKRGSLESPHAIGWRVSPDTVRRARNMLLVHQVGSVRIGEVVRYTLIYHPSHDRILPSPSYLHVKIKNTSAIPLRAAYLHGPYTLYAACYPATFDPNHTHETPEKDGDPEFEPNLRAGGSWMSRLTVPENIRETAGKANVKRETDGSTPSVTWIIEISSQVIFSTSAAVHFELLVGRDEKSIELGFSSIMGQSVATPGQLQDHQQGKRSKDGHHSAAQPKGVFSRAVTLDVDDTASLWNQPTLPEWDDEGKDRGKRRSYPDPGEEDLTPLSQGRGIAEAAVGTPGHGTKPRKRKRVHLVVLTHGLHSNLGADMLYLKESIDAAAKQARDDARKRKRQQRTKTASTVDNEKPADTDERSQNDQPDSSTAPLSGGQNELEPEGGDEDEEEVIVRGFGGNATRTERGIQYLGKRLAKWVLTMTYPDQPFLPAKQSVKKKISRVFTGDQSPSNNKQVGPPPHKHSSIYRPAKNPEDLAYKITSISFISHSLGGLIQTYAIAYIHKHSPNFFTEIKPVNFVAMATPFLGLSNENPLYVRFALDFGLVGRTGQDLGLTWRAPTMVRGGWTAMIGGIGEDRKRAHKQPDPGSKPLLRILPTGHTHQVLKLFRNRTVYSNVVNDGIVPLRTSCLLFLDWSGLGRVEKARRENGLVGTMAGWGWQELTGANSSARFKGAEYSSEVSSQIDLSGDGRLKAEVPQPEENAVKDDTTVEGSEDPNANQFIAKRGKRFQDEQYDATEAKESSPQQPSHPLTGFLSFLRPNQQKTQHPSPKQTKAYKRGQTTRFDADGGSSQSSESSSSLPNPALAGKPGIVRGDSIIEDSSNGFAPPKTTIFESAGDILNPPLPSREFLIDPRSRPRTIFHDRVYHPEDIPPPAFKKRGTLARTFSTESRSKNSIALENQPKEPTDLGDMKVEEKIARAYHHGLSWRKVLVRLEPDAHNNMVVRRMFANAYGWPVIKHLVDTHFANTFAANTADKEEPSEERAKPMDEAVGEHGEEVSTNTGKHHRRTDSELHEAKDSVPDLRNEDHSMSSSFNRPTISRQDSAQWDDALFEVTDDEDDIETPIESRHRRRISLPNGDKPAEFNPNELNSQPEIANVLTDSPPDTNGKRTELPLSTPPRGISTVGLGKSVEERLVTPKKGLETSEEQKKDKELEESADIAKLQIEAGN